MTTDEKRIEAHKKLREAYGTSQIFRHRANFYRAGLRRITFLGIAVPVLIGGVVLSFSNYKDVLPFLLPVVGVVSVAQLVISVWSLVNKWDDAFEYSIRSQSRNSEMEYSWHTLVSSSPADIDAQFEGLRMATAQQAQDDEKHNVSQKERRRAMRATLFKFQLACAVCKQLPTSMQPTDCDCCGNF